jgi:hypothetical protein
MKAKFTSLVALGACLLFLASAAFAGSINVTIPDPAPQAFIYFGTGDASVTYSGVTFSQQAALSNGNFFNVGFLFSGFPAVLSSQEQTIGVPNILVTLPVFSTAFAVNYGTFGGSAVTFLLSNGDHFTLGSTASGYQVPDLFSVTDSPFNTILITTPNGLDALDINNIFYTPISEPGTLAIMFGSGIFGLVGVLRRKLI